MAGSILFSQVDGVASQFADIIPEFRSFLGGGGVPVGTMGAVTTLAERVATPGAFRAELSSMVNALCSVDEAISFQELLTVLLVAAAGEEGAEAVGRMPAFAEPVCTLFNFVIEAKRARATADFSEAEEIAGLEAPTVGNLVESHAEPAPAPAPAPVLVEEESVREAPAAELVVASSEPKMPQTVVAEPVAAQASEAVPVDAAAARSEIAEPRLTERVAWSPTILDDEPAALSRWRRVPGWALALCGVLLGFVAGYIWHGRGGAPSSNPAAVAGTSAAGDNAVGGRIQARHPAQSGRAVVPERETASADEGTISGPSEATSNRGRTHRPAASSRSGVSDAAGGAARSGGDGAGTGTAAAAESRPSAGSANSRFIAQPVDLNGGVSANSAAAGRGARVHLPSVVTGASGIMAANLISSPAPAYPPAATAQRVQGEVVIEAVVGRDGRVMETRVVSGPELLREAAERAVQQWQYRPYEVDGTPTAIATTARLEFRLGD